ncbi:MAG: D-glycero-beta-D-manno-heptose-7-phosphate kinase, partial [bacterium]|nr:D-glycero-beta-D-manno-heptose-7-phosphate kinase [bacterium]
RNSRRIYLKIPHPYMRVNVIPGGIMEHLPDTIKQFKETNTLIIGDVMMDEYVWGEVSRISPEAPVPVVDVSSQSFVPGGAANVANNIRALNGKVHLIGVIGNDGIGRKLSFELGIKQIAVDRLIVDHERPTILKTRIIASNQQIVRVDKELKKRIAEEIEAEIIAKIEEVIPEVNVIVISDYGKGVITEKLISNVVSLSRKYQKKVILDPKVENYNIYKEVTLITPNQKEAREMLRTNISTLEDLNKAGHQILEDLNCEVSIITRGKDGMSIFERGKSPIHIPTIAREVFDVAGAGDTVVAVIALALALDLTFVNAALLANCAAGIVVGKVGTATVSPNELVENVEAVQRLELEIEKQKNNDK